MSEFPEDLKEEPIASEPESGKLASGEPASGEPASDEPASGEPESGAPETEAYAERMRLLNEAQAARAAERRRELPLILAVIGLCLNFIFGAGVLFSAAGMALGVRDYRKNAKSQKALWAATLGGVGLFIGALFIVCACLFA